MLIAIFYEANQVIFAYLVKLFIFLLSWRFFLYIYSILGGLFFKIHLVLGIWFIVEHLSAFSKALFSSEVPQRQNLPQPPSLQSFCWVPSLGAKGPVCMMACFSLACVSIPWYLKAWWSMLVNGEVSGPRSPKQCWIWVTSIWWSGP